MHYFYGEDTYAAREEVERIAKECQATVSWLDQEDITNQSMAEALSPQGGLFGATVTVMRDPSKLSKAAQEDIIAALKKQASEAILWDRQAPDKRSKLWKAVKKEAREFSALSEEKLVMWLQVHATSQQVTMADDATRELIRRAGSDRWRLKNELERLALLDSSITLQLVHDHVDEAAAADIFPTLDALVRGDKATALKNVETLLAEGNSEFYILSMLAYQFRVLLLITDGKATGKTDQEISRLGNLHPFVVQKNAAVTQRFSVDQLRDILTKIMATDVAIKQGKVAARTGLMMLLVGLL